MSKDPTGRALELLSLLQTHRRWTGPELADRLEVSSRTLRRDVDRLRDLGYPVEATPGTDGGYRLAAGAHMPPLVLDDEEAVAIAVGLRTCAGAAIDGIEDTSLRALAKLEQILPDRLRRRVSAIHSTVVTLDWEHRGPTVDPDALAVLAQACRDHEEVRFDYRRRDGEDSRRLVEPHQLVSAGRRWYLAAFDVRQQGWRTFRLDRLTVAQLAGRRFAPRPIPGGNAADYVAASLSAIPRALEATVHLRCGRDEAAELLRWTDHEIISASDGNCHVRLRADSVQRIVSAIAFVALTVEVRVEQPEDIAAAVDALGRRLVRSQPA